ncbi:hypothetical protein FRB95_003567 [Tulasnella sp. JGI-2019a]|nr:hypothetical protein FRB95_003567 [Tulasnella sp. JGI-2019a]
MAPGMRYSLRPGATREISLRSYHHSNALGLTPFILPLLISWCRCTITILTKAVVDGVTNEQAMISEFPVPAWRNSSRSMPFSYSELFVDAERSLTSSNMWALGCLITKAQGDSSTIRESTHQIQYFNRSSWV